MTDHRAQRLWLLERHGGDQEAPGHSDACRFTSALTILDDWAIFVVLVRSADPQGGEDCLGSAGLRVDLERDALKFSTLDEAMAWCDATKRTWLSRGWTEVGDGFE